MDDPQLLREVASPLCEKKGTLRFVGTQRIPE